MTNILDIRAEDGEFIQINQQELETKAGREWLEAELKKHRNKIKDATK